MTLIAGISARLELSAVYLARLQRKKRRSLEQYLLLIVRFLCFGCTITAEQLHCSCPCLSFRKGMTYRDLDGT